MRCDNHNCKSTKHEREACPLPVMCSGCHSLDHTWGRCLEVCTHCGGKHRVDFCQDFKPGVGGKPRTFGAMPVDRPHPKSFKTHLEAILKGTDSQTGPIKPRPTTNPPPRETYGDLTGDEPLAKRPKLSHPLPSRPPSHPLPPRPPHPAAVEATQVVEEPVIPAQTTARAPELIRTEREPLFRGPPAALLPLQFYGRARAALPNSRAKPGKKCPPGTGRYSAMPPPADYGNQIHSLTVDLSEPQEVDDFVEGTQWTFPPPCKDWEKAVGYERPTKAELEAERQESAQAQALAAQDPDGPEELGPTIRIAGIGQGVENEIEISRSGLGLRQLIKYNWPLGGGLGPNGRGILQTVNTLNAPKPDDEHPTVGYSKLPLLFDEDN